MNYQVISEKWKVSKIIELASNRKLVLLPHQRPKNKKNINKRMLIDDIINENLLVDFIFSDLITNLEYSKLNNNSNDSSFFSEYVDKNNLYSIEDSQHRISVLQLIDDSDFMDMNEKKKFLNSYVFVKIIKYTSRNRLISLFGKINGGATVTNDEKLWGVNNEFNNSIKTYIKEQDLIRIYKGKDIEKNKRDIYKNVTKILKVSLSHEGIGITNDTIQDSMKEFVNSNLNIKLFINFNNLMVIWKRLVNYIDKKTTFVSQSNLYFIIHILSCKKYFLTDDKLILDILKKVNSFGSRGSAEIRYTNILNYINSEEFRNARTLVENT